MSPDETPVETGNVSDVDTTPRVAKAITKTHDEWSALVKGFQGKIVDDAGHDILSRVSRDLSSLLEAVEGAERDALHGAKVTFSLLEHECQQLGIPFKADNEDEQLMPSQASSEPTTDTLANDTSTTAETGGTTTTVGEHSVTSTLTSDQTIDADAKTD